MAYSENTPTSGGGPMSGMDNVSSLLTLNNLNYQLPNDLSVSVARTHTNEFFQAKNFSPGQSMINILNTGSAYINATRSYLRLDIKNTGTGPMHFGATGGNASGLFERLLISSRDGSVLERIDSVGMLSRIRQNYDSDQEYTQTVLSAAGSKYKGNTTAIDAGVTIRCVVPLSLVSPLFDTDQLFPNSLASGMRIELQLASADKAFVRTSGTAALNYEIVDCCIVTESYMLSDLVLRTLNQISSSSGLEYVFNSWFTTSDKRTTNSMEIESRKAVSRALAAVYCEQKVATLDVPEVSRDSYSSAAPTFLEAQYRIGSQYYPQAPLRGSTAALLSPELYAYSLLAFNKYGNRTTRAGATLENYELANGSAIAAATLERDTLGGSGVPLSNSRVLAFSASFETDAETTIRNSWLFLKYTSLARVFLSNLVLET